MKAFFGMLDEQPVKIILFGDACSVVTDPIAKAIKFFHLIQVSFISHSLLLSPITNDGFTLIDLILFFPHFTSSQLSYADTFTATTANFFRIVPSEESFNPGIYFFYDCFCARLCQH